MGQDHLTQFVVYFSAGDIVDDGDEAHRVRKMFKSVGRRTHFLTHALWQRGGAALAWGLKVVTQTQLQFQTLNCFKMVKKENEEWMNECFERCMCAWPSARDWFSFASVIYLMEQSELPHFDDDGMNGLSL